MTPQTILISRTDSIGDVMLTLPMAGQLKLMFPQARILFLGRNYTRDVVKCCIHVDAFYSLDDWKTLPVQAQIDAVRELKADVIVHVFPQKEVLWLAKRAGIPVRIATGRRWFTLMKANRPVFFTRKNSPLHEAQLNMKLLQPLGLKTIPTLDELAGLYGFNGPAVALPTVCTASAAARKVILHPLSKGSAVNWDLGHFKALAQLLVQQGCEVYITGTAQEGERIEQLGGIHLEGVTNLCGQLQLNQLIAFIAQCDALVAASTGPLHIAAALGIHAVGLYTPKRPMHPGRWSPVGVKVHVITAESHPAKDAGLEILPEKVLHLLVEAWSKQ